MPANPPLSLGALTSSGVRAHRCDEKLEQRRKSDALCWALKARRPPALIRLPNCQFVTFHSEAFLDFVKFLELFEHWATYVPEQSDRVLNLDAPNSEFALQNLKFIPNHSNRYNQTRV